MKKILIFLVVILILFGSSCQAETNFEKWKFGIEEVIKEVNLVYGDRLERAAEEHEHIEKIDLWAKVVVESNGNKSAVSSTSVKGLTMLTLEVVELIENETGTVIDRLHPFEAMWGTGWYLNYLRKTYEFSIDEAHAAYFLGPGGLQQELKRKKLEDIYHLKKIRYVKERIKEIY